MARYGQAYKDRAVARLLPLESAAVETVAREIGVAAGTLQRWREDAPGQAHPGNRPAAFPPIRLPIPLLLCPLCNFVLPPAGGIPDA